LSVCWLSGDIFFWSVIFYTAVRMVSEEGSDGQGGWDKRCIQGLDGETFMKETARCSWEGDIKMDLKDMWWEDMVIHLALSCCLLWTQ
jgi:hypothetical protein